VPFSEFIFSVLGNACWAKPVFTLIDKVVRQMQHANTAGKIRFRGLMVISLIIAQKF
jgi:hypothetical protein